MMSSSNAQFNRHLTKIDFTPTPQIKSKYECPTSHAKKKKSVRMSPTSSLHRYFNAGAVDDCQEPISTWHNKQEFATFRRLAKKEASFLRMQLDDMSLVELSLGVHGDAIDSDNKGVDIEVNDNLAIVTRGLEHLLNEHTLDKMVSTRTKHKNAVLEEQWRQYELNGGVVDPMALRKISKMHTSWGKRRAVAIAGGCWRGTGGGPTRSPAA